MPTPTAPETLLPGVMTAIGEQDLGPWHARPWAMWPRVPRIAFLVVGVALIIGVTAFWPAGESPGVWTETLRQIHYEIRDLGVVLGAIFPLWRVLLQPLVGYLFVLFTLSSVAIALLWTALTEVALGSMRES